MHHDLVKLLELQAKDLTLFETDRRLDAVLAELERLDQEIHQAEGAVASARRSVEDAEKRRGELEVRIDGYRRQQERRKLAIESVRWGKDAANIMAEMDLTRSVLVKEEGDLLRASEGVTGLETAVLNAEQRLEDTLLRQQPIREEIGGRRGVIELERAAALAERDSAATEVSKTLRTRYERLRNSRARRVVVPLAGPACGACFTTIPLNRRTQIVAGALIDWCEACGVILYAAEPVG